MMVKRYVEFVTTDGKHKATRRMSQRAYIAKMMLLNLIAMLAGAVVGIRIWSELQ